MQGGFSMRHTLFRKIISTICALALVAALMPAALAAGFTDVKSGDWYFDAVNWAVENGITSGMTATKFAPNQTCSNGQILTFLWRAAGEPSPGIANPFRNITTGDYYYEPAIWASEQGMVSGGSFNASAPCTRAMAVTYIWQAKGKPNAASSASFKDVSAENAALSAPVSWAVENGVTSGTGNNAFSPNATCTRAEIVTFLLRAYGGGAVTPSTQPQNEQCAELMRLINAERKKAGLNELTTTDALTKAAQIRAQELSNGYFETRADGSDWVAALDECGVVGEYANETMLGGSPDASFIFSQAMASTGKDAILSGEYNQIAVGYYYNANGYGGFTDFWSILYVSGAPSESAAPATSVTPTTGGSAAFTPVPMKDLANLKGLQKSATDEQFTEAYNKAVEVVRPLAGLSREEQLQGIASALREMFDSGMDYSTTAEHYNDPYGYFVLGMASCAGCTRATGLCLNILGIPYEHVNENQWSHQWCRVNVNGTYWICDAYGLYCGPEPAPYEHPYL